MSLASGRAHYARHKDRINAAKRAKRAAARKRREGMARARAKMIWSVEQIEHTRGFVLFLKSELRGMRAALLRAH